MGYKRKRGDSWQLQYYDKDGKKCYLTFKGTAREADKKLEEIEVDIERGEFIQPSKLTFYEFLTNEFLPHIKADCDEGTYTDYKSITENHIKTSSLGKMVITKITVRECEAYKLLMLTNGRIDGRKDKLSPKTVKNHIIMIKAAFNYACELGMFNYSPVQHLKYPKVPKYIPTVFSEDQALRFIECAKEEELYLFFLLAIYTGLRKGELRGITWSAIDMDKCLICITQQVRKDGNKAVYKEPKTNESIATVSFDPEFLPLFEEQRKKQIRDMEKCMRLGEEYKNKHLVFTGYNGNPVDNKVIDRALKRICRAANVPIIRPHDLRHTCATILLARGVHLKTIQERLRHRDIRTTGNIYSHVLPRLQAEANEHMGKVLRIKKDAGQVDRQTNRRNG